MYSLLKNLGVKEFLITELPSLGISFVIAELFFKFGSFMLESIAFLSTWWAVSFLFNKAIRKH